MNNSNRDPLTQVGNLESLQARFAELSGDKARFGMIFFDINEFIYFNDRYGHIEGDRKLQEIACLICQNAPSETDVFRSGEDEFVLFMNDFKMAEVLTTAIQICLVINRHFSHIPPFKRIVWMPDKSSMEIKRPLTVSCGVVFYPEQGVHYDSLRQLADEAAYTTRTNLHGGVIGVAEFYRTCPIPQ